MTPHSLPHLATRIFGPPLLIERRKLDVILSVLGPRLNIDASGTDVTVEAYGPGDEARKKPYYVSENGIAIIGVVGPLVARDSGDYISGGPTTYREIDDAFMDAATDPKIQGIVLDFDSPGGEAGGCFDLADQIYSARGMKPVYSVANEYTFSAAYAIASAADRLYVTRTGGVGSIGVYMLHVDQSALNAKVGVKPTFIHAGAKKVLGNSYEPLSDDARAMFQSEVDKVYDLFCSTVARNRHMPEAAVRATEAGCYWGDEGVMAGLADQVGTLRDAINDMQKDLKQPQRSFGMAASAATIPTQEKNMNAEEQKADAVEETPAAPVEESTEKQEPAADSEETLAAAAEPTIEPTAEPETANATTLAPLVASAREAGYAEAGQIVSLFLKAGKPKLAQECLAAKMTLQQAKEKLLSAFVADTEANPVASAHDSGMSGADPMSQLQAKAAAIKAASPGMSEAQAIAEAARQNPKLYEQYEQSKQQGLKK